MVCWFVCLLVRSFVCLVGCLFGGSNCVIVVRSGLPEGRCRCSPVPPGGSNCVIIVRSGLPEWRCRRCSPVPPGGSKCVICRPIWAPGIPEGRCRRCSPVPLGGGRGRVRGVGGVLGGGCPLGAGFGTRFWAQNEAQIRGAHGDTQPYVSLLAPRFWHHLWSHFWEPPSSPKIRHWVG